MNVEKECIVIRGTDYGYLYAFLLVCVYMMVKILQAERMY